MKGKMTIYRKHYKSIITLGMPLLLGQLGMIMTGFADTFMVGHYSTDSLAAASFVNNVMNFMTVLCMGFLIRVDTHCECYQCSGRPFRRGNNGEECSGT